MIYIYIYNTLLVEHIYEDFYENMHDVCIKNYKLLVQSECSKRLVISGYINVSIYNVIIFTLYYYERIVIYIFLFVINILDSLIIEYIFPFFVSFILIQT